MPLSLLFFGLSMTTIAYYQGQLIGDRKQVALTDPTSFRDGTKAFVSEDGSFAYGFSGDAVSESMRKTIEGAIRRIIQKVLLSSSATVDIDNSELVLIKGLSVGVIATKQNAWFLNSFRGTALDLDGHAHGCGTGGAFLCALLTCGMTLEEAMVKCAEFDPMSSPNMDIIKLDELEDFVITVGESQ